MFIRRAIFNFLLAGLGFGVFCFVWGKVVPVEVSVISGKLRLFAREKDRSDVAFIGTSRVYHGIAPKTFDQTAASLGYPCASFNAGVDGMTPGERMAMARRLAAMQPARLRYLFLEVSEGMSNDTHVATEGTTERAVYWHDWRSFVSNLRVFCKSVTSPSSYYEGRPFSLPRLKICSTLLLSELALWGRNQTNFGRGYEWIEQWTKPAHGFRVESMGPDWRGYYAMTTPMMAETLADYRARFARKEAAVNQHPADPVLRDEMMRLVNELAPRKIKVVFLLMPGLKGGREKAGAETRPRLFLRYDDYARFADFYAEGNRLDSVHLNGQGAELFSSRLAADFVRAARPVLR